MNEIFSGGAQELNAWKTDIHKYEKDKRTKKPFGQSVPKVERVSQADIKSKDLIFNPILQKYSSQQDDIHHKQVDQSQRAKSLIKHFRNTNKYQKNYDIINLYGEPMVEQKINKKLGPIRNMYDVINNQKIPQHMYQNRQLKLPNEKHTVILQPPRRQYNPVTGIYQKNNEERCNLELSLKDQKALNKYWETHDYDPVFGKYYDPAKQQQFKEQLVAKMKEQASGKEYEKRFPPSYIHRQSYIADYSKPLPDNLKLLDQKNKNAKKRYKLKYIIEEEYQRRNQDDQEKQERIIKNKVHNSKIQQEKYKQFDILTMKHYEPTRAQQLFGKKTVVSTWDKLQNQNNKIKSSGFH